MIRRICFGVTLVVVVLFVFLTPAGAQTDISGWWSVKGTYLQGDFVTGDWTTLQARGKKMSYLYIFQNTSTDGTGYFVLWDDLSAAWILEVYTVYFRNGVLVLYIPTGFDESGNPAAANIIMKTIGSPGTITSMNGYYSVYDMESSVTTDQFVRMGPVLANRVQVSLVPSDVKALIP